MLRADFERAASEARVAAFASDENNENVNVNVNVNHDNNNNDDGVNVDVDAPQDDPQDVPQDDQQGQNQYLSHRGGGLRRSRRRRRSVSYADTGNGNDDYDDGGVSARRRVRRRLMPNLEINLQVQQQQQQQEVEEDNIFDNEVEDSVMGEDDDDYFSDYEENGPVDVLAIRYRIREEAAANRAASGFSPTNSTSTYNRFSILPPPPGVNPPELHIQQAHVPLHLPGAAAAAAAAVEVSPSLALPRFTSAPPTRANVGGRMNMMGNLVTPRAILSSPPVADGHPNMGASSLYIDKEQEDELRREAAEALMLL